MPGLSRKFALNPDFSLRFLARNNGPEVFPLRVPHAKAEPIPTEWPNLLMEKIPTEWPNLKLLPVNGNLPTPTSKLPIK